MSHRVQIADGHHEVLLPDGTAYDAGDIAVISDAQWEQLDDSLVGTVLIDLGEEGGGGSGLLKKRLVLQITDPVQIGGGEPSSGTLTFGGLLLNEMGDDIIFFDSAFAPTPSVPLNYGQIMTAGLYTFEFSWVGQGLLGSNVTYGGVTWTLVTPGDPNDPSLIGTPQLLTPDAQPNLSPAGNEFRQAWIAAASAPYPGSADSIFAVQYSFDADGDSPGGYMLVQGAQLTIMRMT